MLTILSDAVLKTEMETAMRLLGVQSIDQLGPQYVSFSFAPFCFG